MPRSLLIVLFSKKAGVLSLLFGVGIVTALATVDPMLFSAAAVVVIGSIATATVTIIGALSKMRVDIIAKSDVIAGHVDGMASAAAAKRTADDDTIASLRHQLADAERRASLLAQARANETIIAAGAMPAAPVPVALEHVSPSAVQPRRRRDQLKKE